MFTLSNLTWTHLFKETSKEVIKRILKKERFNIYRKGSKKVEDGTKYKYDMSIEKGKKEEEGNVYKIEWK